MKEITGSPFERTGIGKAFTPESRVRPPLFLSLSRRSAIRSRGGHVESDAVNRELIKRARGGDHAALGELLEKYRRYLWGLADRMLDDRAAARIDASDVVQQTCLSVHKQITEFEGHDDAQFVAWLRQI